MADRKTYQDSILFKQCIEHSVDTVSLGSLCDLISPITTFDNFPTALVRLKAIIPRAQLFNPTIPSETTDQWLDCIDHLLSQSESIWFKQAVKYTVAAKQNSTNILGAEHIRGHEFYAALLADSLDTSTEDYLISVLAIAFAVKMLATKTPSNNQMVVVVDAARQASKRYSIWEQAVTELMSGDRIDPIRYLERLSQRCWQFNQDKNQDYREGQWSFSRALLECVNSLLSNNRANPAPYKPPQVPRLKSVKSPHTFTFNPVGIDVEDLENLARTNGGFRPFVLKPFRIKPTKSDYFDPEALDDEDVDRTHLILYSPEIPIEEEPLSDAGLKTRARYSRFVTEADNQYLPIRWRALNQYELNEIIHYLNDVNTKQTERIETIAALVIALTLVTGQSFEAILDFQLNLETVDQTARNSLQKVDGHYFWCHLIPELENRFQPNERQRLDLVPVGDQVILPLPDVVNQLLDSCLKASHLSGTLLANLECSAADLKENLSEQFIKLRQSRRNRNTLSRIRGALFDLLLQVSGDVVAAYTVLGLDGEQPLSGLYYTTFATADLQALYSLALQRLNLTRSPLPPPASLKQSEYVGSQCFISMAFMRATSKTLETRAQTLLEKLNDSSGLDDIREAHNAYTTYVVMLLLFSTGHRAVNDPFHDPYGFLTQLNGVLITDKVEMQEHEGRLVWFGQTAQAQLVAYMSHLKGLVSRLVTIDRNLAFVISTLYRSITAKQIPFVFYLSSSGWLSVRPGTLQRELNGIWRLPLNSNRHFLATQLRRLQVPSEYISYQLGHTQIGQLPFGQFSTLSPAMVGRYLVPAITQLEAESGWVCLAGFPHSQKNLDPECQENSSDLKLFGPALRERVRQELQQTDKAVVRAAIRTVNRSIKTTDATVISDEAIAAVLTEIETRSMDDPDGFVRQQNLFRKFLKVGRVRNKWQAKIPSLAIEVKGEKSPLTYDDGRRLSAIKTIRSHFLRLLSDKFTQTVFPPVAGNPKSLAEYFAYCHLSALLFGQLCNRQYLDEFPQALSENVQVYDNKLWITFYKNTATQAKISYRWFPDELSTVLILRLHHALTVEEIKAVTAAEIKKATESLSQKLFKHAIPEQILAQENPVDCLMEWLQKDHALNFPGIIRAFLNGDVEAWSLPDKAWSRLLTQKPLIDHLTAEDTENSEGHWSSVGSQTPVITIDKQALRELTGLLRNSLDVTSGKNPNPDDVRNPTQRRRDLKRDLKQWSNHWSRQCSSTLILLFEWITHLEANGTDYKRSLKSSTLYLYLTTLATPLIEQCWELDLLELDEDEVLQAYEVVLDQGEDSHRPYRAARLREFHQFICKEYGAAKIDFGELDQDSHAYGVDANFVSPAEYKRALRLLVDDPGHQTFDRLLHGLLLCLIYRNGLRPGEALRLLISDVVLEKSPVVYIRNNYFGTCKSINGVRQIPFLRRLDAEEVQLMQRWLEHRQSMETDHVKSPFFTREILSRSLVAQQQIKYRVIQALRIATGDPSVSLRHLRHSFATGFVGAAMAIEQKTFDGSFSRWVGEGENDREKFAQALFGQPVASRRTIYQLTNLLGHGSPETSIKNYCHILDYVVAEYRPRLPVILSGNEIMAMLGYSSHSLRTTCKRLGINAADIQLADLIPLYIKKAPSHLKLTINTHSGKHLTLPPLTIPSVFPALDTLASILNAYTRDVDIESLARRYFYSPEQIEKWIDSAKHIQYESGYRRFNIKLNTPVGWDLVNEAVYEEMTVNDQNEIQSVRKNLDRAFVHQLEKMLKNSNDPFINRLGEIWIKSYKPKSKGFYLATQTEAEELIQLLDKCCINRSRIYLEIPDNFKVTFERARSAWNSWLAKHQIPITNIRYLNNKVLPRKPDGQNIVIKPVPGIKIMSPDDSDFMMGYLNYYLFLASVLTVR